MKKLLFNLLTMSMLLAFTACGGDDDKTEFEFIGDCKQSIEVKGFAGQLTSTDPAVVSSLDNMLQGASGYGSPVTAGEFMPTPPTSVEITGLAEGVTLEGFKISINGQEESFGNVTPVQGTTGFDLYTGSHMTYFTNAFNRMVSNRKLETKITFTPSADILPADGVKLEISFAGRFSYWK